MANWKEYTTKTTPEDADEIMIADSKANVSKRTPFSGLWNWIAGKLATAVISQLETQNKSIIPALNELNSKTQLTWISNVDVLEYMEQYSGTFSGVAFSNSLTNGPKGWEFFSVVIVNERAIAFGPSISQESIIYVSTHANDKWQTWRKVI